MNKLLHAITPQVRVLLWKHRWKSVAVFLLIILGSALEGISFSLLVPLTQTFSASSDNGSPSGTAFPFYQAWLASYSINERLAVLGIALLALFALKNGVQYLREVLSTSLWISISAE